MKEEWFVSGEWQEAADYSKKYEVHILRRDCTVFGNNFQFQGIHFLEL